MHHQHLAHGLAVERLRELADAAGRDIQLGITLNLTNAVPNDPTDPVDLDAARRIDALWNRMYLDPLLLGAYPADLLDDVARLRPRALAPATATSTQIAQPIDFLGVNHYHDDNVSGHPLPAGTPALAEADRRSSAASPFVGSEYVTMPSRDLPRTAMDWEVHPDGLRTLLVRLGREYPNLPPLYVTENGAAYDGDVVTEAGAVHDPERTRVHPRATSTPSSGRSRTAPTCADTSSGRCSTTSSGRGATRSGSASSTSTTTRWCAPPRTARSRSRGSSPTAKTAAGVATIVG